jgi:hypothetical protein
MIAGIAIAVLCLLVAAIAAATEFASGDWSAVGFPLTPTVVLPIMAAALVLSVSVAFYANARRQAAAHAQRVSHADAPWNWRSEWRHPAILADSGRGLWLLWGFGLVWTAMWSWPWIDILSGPDWREHVLALAVTALPALFGLALIAGAGYLQVQRAKYGVARFMPDTLPGEIGGRLRGMIEVPARVRLLEGRQVELVLCCQRLVTTGHGKSRRTSTTTVWESTRQIPASCLSAGAKGTAIPVDFEIPFGMPESTPDVNLLDRVEWRLTAKAETRGIDLGSSFAVPVFLTAAASEREAGLALAGGAATPVPGQTAAAASGTAALDPSALSAVKVMMVPAGPSVRLGAGDYLRVALQNGIPAFGVLFLGWSVPLMLLLYWLENLVGSVRWNRLIRRHERLTHLRGHYRNQFGGSANGREIGRFASEHAAGTIAFTLAHGVSLFVFAFLILDGATLLQDLPWVVVLACGALLAVAFEVRPLHRGLEQRSFGWLREQARVSMWPVIAMHLGVIFGGLALSTDGGVGLALVFIALRVCVDLGRAWYRKNPSVAIASPPAPQAPGQDQVADQLYQLKLARFEAQLHDEEVCPAEERPGYRRASR